jgi:hypothetical protein
VEAKEGGWGGMIVMGGVVEGEKADESESDEDSGVVEEIRGVLKEGGVSRCSMKET